MAQGKTFDQMAEMLAEKLNYGERWNCPVHSVTEDASNIARTVRVYLTRLNESLNQYRP